MTFQPIKAYVQAKTLARPTKKLSKARLAMDIIHVFRQVGLVMYHLIWSEVKCLQWLEIN